MTISASGAAPTFALGALREDGSAAARQLATLASTLRSAGATTLELPPRAARDTRSAAAEAAFTRDDAVLLERRGQRVALLTRPRSGQHRAAQGSRATALYRAGFQIHAPVCPAFDGGDVVLLPGAACAVLGHGARSSFRAASCIARFLDAPVVPLRLRDASLVRLDTVLNILDDGTALACGAALEPGALEVLAGAPGIRRVIDVPRAEALAFGLAMVDAGATVVVGARLSAIPTVTAAITARGKRIAVCDLSAFDAGGRSAAQLATRVEVSAPPKSAHVPEAA